MNSRETAYLILRIFALFVVIISLNIPLNYLYSFVVNSSPSSMVPPIDYVPMLISFFPLAFGTYLWLSAKKLCSLFILEPDTSLINESNYSLNILKLALVIMGLYMMTNAIPFIFQAIVSFSMMTDHTNEIPTSYYNMYKQNLLLQGSVFAIGFSMVVGNNFYAYWLGKARTFGLKK